MVEAFRNIISLIKITENQISVTVLHENMSYFLIFPFAAKMGMVSLPMVPPMIMHCLFTVTQQYIFSHMCKELCFQS